MHYLLNRQCWGTGDGSFCDTQSLEILTSTREAVLSRWYSAACEQITLTDPIQHRPWHSQYVNKCKLTTFLPKKASLEYCLPEYLRSHADVLRQIFQKNISFSNCLEKEIRLHFPKKKSFPSKMSLELQNLTYKSLLKNQNYLSFYITV